MKICVIHNRYRFSGGEESAVQAEVAMLRELGHSVLLIEVSNRNAEHGRLDLIFSLLFSSWNAKVAEGLTTKVRAFDPDVVHIHNFWYMLSPALHLELSKAGYPVVQTLHNYRLLCANALLSRNGRPCELCLHTRGKGLYGAAYKCYGNSMLLSYLVGRMVRAGWRKGVWDLHVNAYIVLTEFAKSKFSRAGLPEAKIHVKPNAIEDLGFAGMRHRTANRAIYVGRLSMEKGVMTLFEAFKGLNEGLLVCGTGPLEGALKASCPGNIVMRGSLPHADVLSAIRDCSFLILPSTCYEGMPMSIIEAFSCGVPCVASRIGGIPEVVVDGHTGLLFEPGNPEDLRLKVQHLFGSMSEVDQMGKNALSLYKSKFTREINSRSLLGVYRESIENKLVQKNQVGPQLWGMTEGTTLRP